MKRGRRFLAVLSTITLSLSLFIMPVNAESDIYYPDPESYGAYNYFFAHGYNHLLLSSTSNVTYNVNLDNIGTNNGTITGTDGLTGSSHTTGTINSNNSSLGSKYLTCTTNNAVSGTQTYSCYFSSSSSSVANSQSITIKMNENTYSDYSNVDINVNESIKQNINTDITGSITSSDSSKTYAYLPWCKGTYTKPSSFNWNDAIWMSQANDNFRLVYLIFYTTSRIGDKSVSIYTNSADTVTIVPTLSEITVNGLYLNRLKLECTSGAGNFTFAINGLSSQDVVPIFFGLYNQMPDDIAVSALLRKTIGQYLSTGDDYSSGIISDASNANNTMNNKITQFDNIETNSVNSMNTTIQSLNTTPDILGNSKFLSSAQWVKTQFDRMTVNTPVGSVLSFSLILGITLIFMGKIR